MIIVVRFDFEVKQFDITNVFFYSNINKEYGRVFCKLSDGYKEFLGFSKGSTDGMAVELEKALYSFRESLLLWYNEFASVFKAAGLDKVNEELCIFTNGRILVFFYVDDIFVFYCNKEQ